MVGKNLQQLEVGEEQTRVREEKLQAQIMDLRYKTRQAKLLACFKSNRRKCFTKGGLYECVLKDIRYIHICIYIRKTITFLRDIFIKDCQFFRKK